MEVKIKDYPADVEEIIEYTKLRKKYPELDRQLRIERLYKDSISFGQMKSLLHVLREKDEEAKNQPKCNLCGRKYDPDENGLEKEELFPDKGYCSKCRKPLAPKYRKQKKGVSNNE